MSIIACTSDCVYQQDGNCSLERAASSGLPSATESCINFVPRRKSNSTIQSAPAVPPADRL